jgi:hypothetical protein
LEQLAPVLGITGAFKNDDAVSAVIERMQDCPTFMQKCVYVEVIRATENPTILESFMVSGGWTILSTWLSDAKKTSNIPLMVELLQVCIFHNSNYQQHNSVSGDKSNSD